MVTAAAPTATATTWVPCQGWFAAQAHDGPGWIGFSDGRIAEISNSPPANGDRRPAQEGIDINLAAGVDFIEHAYFVREDQIDRMVEQGACWTPTLAPVHAQADAECGWPDEVRRNIEAILDEHLARIGYAVSKAANVLVGTDAGSPGVEMGRGIRTELERMQSAGIPAEKLLRMATVGNARAMGAKDHAATLQIGAPASFVLYERCPWRDVRNLDSLRQVFVAGQRVR